MILENDGSVRRSSTSHSQFALHLSYILLSINCSFYFYNFNNSNNAIYPSTNNYIAMVHKTVNSVMDRCYGRCAYVGSSKILIDDLYIYKDKEPSFSFPIHTSIP